MSNMELSSFEDFTEDQDNLSFASITTTMTPPSESETPTWNVITNTAFSRLHNYPSCDTCSRAMSHACHDSVILPLNELRFVFKLGSGDIGSVYLVELKEGKGCCLFAAKLMDKKEIASRNKEGRVFVEREILQALDHPFLPTLYATLESPSWSCLLTEFCPGGDLHVLRQRQPDRRFDETAVRFYATEVVAALEYLHMMGIIYRDLKPENVLIRLDGHIMLTDFDLSLKDDNSTSMAQVVTNHDLPSNKSPTDESSKPSQFTKSACILPNCIAPAVSCFRPTKQHRTKRTIQRGAPKIVAEPIDVRSLSFVGTYEYLSPEIVSGEEHGSAVDWWTLGIFIFEMFYGVTPFKGTDDEFTQKNIIARSLEFPKEPYISSSAKDFITQLLNKDPVKRLGYAMGATAIKHHQFFEGVNWALLRRKTPPYTPPPFSSRVVASYKNDNNSIDYF